MPSVEEQLELFRNFKTLREEVAAQNIQAKVFSGSMNTISVKLDELDVRVKTIESGSILPIK